MKKEPYKVPVKSMTGFNTAPSAEGDPINHPSHYTDGNIEVIDFIEDKKFNYHRGNAIKYICRAGKKDNEIQDLNKAIWYLKREIERVKTNG
jgi:hypothetical protein